LEKAGFTLEAKLDNTLYKNGNYEDELIYAVRQEDSDDSRGVVGGGGVLTNGGGVVVGAGSTPKKQGYLSNFLGINC